MKKLFISAIVLIFSLAVIAQDFEGVISWTISMEITDPEMKKKMENANKELSSPENQAKMKELQKQLDDPQMKAMLDQNPQMKDIIEKQIAAMSSGNATGAINSMMPKSIEIKLKSGNSIVKTIGGMMESEILYLKDKDRTFVIDRKSKTYSPQDNKAAESQAQFTVTKTEEFLTILNYKARKFNIEATERGQKMKYQVWATTDIKDIDAKQFSKIRVGRSGNSGFMSKIEGVPLKIQASSPEGNMVMQVASFKKEAQPADLFAIPSGFTEKKSGMGY